MIDVILDVLLDTAKTLPFLFATYLLMELLQRRISLARLFRQGERRWGPVIGALGGALPQCGFAAFSAQAYCEGLIGAGTLIAVFLSTSDAALPLLAAYPDQLRNVLLLLVSKLILGIGAGYLFSLFLQRPEEKGPLETQTDPALPRESYGCGCDSCKGRRTGVLLSSLKHTLEIAVYLLLSLLIISLLFYWVGEERLEKLLLSGNFLQPVVTALIGLIPGCAPSVFLTGLFLKGVIPFGSAVAGLSTGAGFGYLIVMRSRKNRRDGVKLILCTYLAAAAAGVLLNLFL